MLSLWTLMLTLLSSSSSLPGVPGTAVESAAPAPGISLTASSQQAGHWTQPFQALELQTRRPEELRLASLQTLNGVALDWSSRELVAAMGEPVRITYDSITGYTEYHYPEVTAGLYDDTVYYVHADKLQGGIHVNGQFIPLTRKGLDLFLGNPSSRAEDGEVYSREEKVLKVYTSQDGNRTGADLFDEIIS
ncbi:hypothetical protein [Paenibacillus pinistramenti]|uniref:hypothetical protein n=1 Tax=Paenibacillus pinistramenti TaxID=1768003 RepID=UPI0011085145|nr:hypothetical protein [Paenibacillus pinistramenti]